MMGTIFPFKDNMQKAETRCRGLRDLVWKHKGPLEACFKQVTGKSLIWFDMNSEGDVVLLEHVNVNPHTGGPCTIVVTITNEGASGEKVLLNRLKSAMKELGLDSVVMQARDQKDLEEDFYMMLSNSKKDGTNWTNALFRAMRRLDLDSDSRPRAT